MMNWQAAASTTLIELVGHARVGLVTDMDGTISYIVEEPEQAQVMPHFRELFQQLQPKLALLAVVSGRPVDDLRSRVALPGIVYIGSHGLERIVDGHVTTAPEINEYKPLLEQAFDEAKRFIAPSPGLLFEKKPVSFTIHYRQVAEPEIFANTWKSRVEAIAQKYGLKLLHGRKVFELRPPIAIDKGTIFTELVSSYRLDAALYVGDDVTDADALNAARKLRTDGAAFTLGIGVESPEMKSIVRTAADLLASGVDDVSELFSWIAANRH